MFGISSKKMERLHRKINQNQSSLPMHQGKIFELILCKYRLRMFRMSMDNLNRRQSLDMEIDDISNDTTPSLVDIQMNENFTGTIASSMSKSPSISRVLDDANMTATIFGTPSMKNLLEDTEGNYTQTLSLKTPSLTRLMLDTDDDEMHGKTRQFGSSTPKLSDLLSENHGIQIYFVSFFLNVNQTFPLQRHHP
jgi:hypothetical protein